MRVTNPSGIVWVLYNSGHSNKGILYPIGNCIVYDVKRKCCLTASHVLKKDAIFESKFLESDDCKHLEIRPTFICFMVGLQCSSSKPLRFEVLNTVEILPEITALYLNHLSHGDNIPFPKEQAFIPDTKPVNILWPIIICGYPSSIQRFNCYPDNEFMELLYKGTPIYDYNISGIVAAYYHDSAPYFIDSDLLPVFVVDNGVLPGMSGCAVLRNTPMNNKIVGMVVKNIAINSSPEVEDYFIKKEKNKLVHSLCLCVADITI